MDFCFLDLLPFLPEMLSLTIKTLEGCETKLFGETLSILIPTTPVLIWSLFFLVEELFMLWNSVQEGRIF